MRESKIQYDIRLALGQERDLVLWRNAAGAVRDTTGKVVGRFGLVVGASDLIGIHTIRAGALDPDALVGRFCGLELKTDSGRLSAEQERFLNLVRVRGGVAGVARSLDEARAFLERLRRGGNA